jgi:hypothetical protein
MPIGDVNSTERGSGARFNDGKPDLSLIPPLLLPCREDPEHMQLLLGLDTFMFHGDNEQLWNWMDEAMFNNYELCAKVFEYGKRKYAAWNWAKGMAWSVPVACLLRHAHALYYNHEENDPESGLPHIGHILCNLVMLRHFVRYFREGNDLPYKVLNANANT